MLAGVVVVGFVVFGIYQILASGSLMQQAAADLQVVQRNITDGRQDVADRNLERARDHASSAKSRVEGPIVWIGSKLPFVGDDVAAVQSAATVMDSLANESLPQLVEVSRNLTPEALRPRNGRVQLAPIEEVQPLLSKVAGDVDAAHDVIADIDIDGLTGRLQGPMRQLQRQLGLAAGLARRGATAVEVMPEMLGADGRRTYALITQNNAEIRSGGGITGAVAIIRAVNGRITMVEQGTEQRFGVWPKPVLPLTPDEDALFTDRLARFPQNATSTPDFPRTAEILRAMWRKKNGAILDGVVSVDPVAMAYILGGTGPLTLSTGQTLDQRNVVVALENTVYIAQPNFALQDVYFALVGRTLFDAVASGQGSPGGLLDALTTAVNERRIALWSAHPEEQALLQGTTLSGGMPTEPGSRPDLGVYLNDAASDKMSFYLDYKVDVEPRTCNSNGSQLLDVTLTMHSTAPRTIKEFGERLVFAGGYAGAPRLGWIRTTAHLYAPFGGRVTEASLEGEDAPVSTLQHLGREVTSVTIDVGPQQTRSISYTVLTGKDQPGDVELRTTPAALGNGVGTLGRSACR